MKARVVAIAAVLLSCGLLIAGAAGAKPRHKISPAPPGPTYVGRWEAPTYPVKIPSRDVDGWVRLTCVVDLYVHVSGCRVLAESAPNLGFGTTALTVFGEPPVSNLVEGARPVGEVVTAVVRFHTAHGQFPLTLVTARFGAGPVPEGPPPPLPIPLVEAPQPGDQAAPSRSPPRPSVITNPDWLKKPTATDVAAAYPAGARTGKITGRAIIVCMVTVAGTLSDCAVRSQSPAGYGFGEAALKLAPKFRMTRETRDGVPTDGLQVMVFVPFGGKP